MPKSLSRDVQTLSYILKNQDKIKHVITDFNCDFTQSATSVSNNTYAFDLCAMYMAQIGENIKQAVPLKHQELYSLFYNTLVHTV